MMSHGSSQTRFISGPCPGYDANQKIVKAGWALDNEGSPMRRGLMSSLLIASIPSEFCCRKLPLCSPTIRNRQILPRCRQIPLVLSRAQKDETNGLVIDTYAPKQLR
jgi:hypothetical protein